MKDWARPKVYLNIPKEKKTSSGDQIVWKFKREKRTWYKLSSMLPLQIREQPWEQI